MSRTGRPPRPSALKVLEGNPGKRRLPEDEPRPMPVRPDCPDFINDRARAIWADLAGQLEALGVLTSIDQSALSGYCAAYEEAQRLTAWIDKHGYTDTTTNGNVVQRPEVSIRNKAWDRVDKFGAQLGIGAAHRSRVNVKRPDGKKGKLASVQDRTKRGAGAGSS